MRATGGWVQPTIDLGLPGDPSTTADERRADAASHPGYSPGEVRRYTGISYRQLDHWAREGVVVPSVSSAAGSGTRRRYSFRDILAIRVVKRLTDAGVSFRNVRLAVQTLRQLGEDDLASVVLVSDGESVYQCRSDDEVIDLVRGGQGVFVSVSHALADVRAALAEAAPVTDLTARQPRSRRTREPRVGAPAAPAAPAARTARAGQRATTPG